jgi:uncharacterized protein with von Willebrand factor type A (vWA) domain
MYRPRSDSGRSPDLAVSRDQGGKASELFHNPEIEEFLERFPQEEEAILEEIANFLESADRRLKYLRHGGSSNEAHQDETFEDLREIFLKTLREKMRRYIQVFGVVGPLVDHLGSGWDLSTGALRPYGFDIWTESLRITENEPRIRDVARRLGRLDRALKLERAEWLRSLGAPQWTIRHALPSTLVGIHESDDLNNLIISEAALLATPETRELFYLKFADKKLLTYDYESHERTPARLARPRRQRTAFRRKGPVILALDTSGSMTGAKERQAKALALALIRIAYRQRRKVHVISFSSQTTALTLSPSRPSLREMADFLLMSFHGGTDIGCALDGAFDVLRRSDFRLADLIFLTDAVTEPFNLTQVESMQDARERGTRFYGMVIGHAENPGLFEQLDEVWRYNGTNLHDVARSLEVYGRSPLVGPMRSTAK